MKPRVLVVDGDPEARDVTATCLRRNGFIVESAADGAEGMRSIQTAGPDVVLSEVAVPKLTGTEILAHVRALPNRRNVVFIFLTNDTSYSSVRGAMESGADDYIFKPVSCETLLNSIPGPTLENSSIKSRSATTSRGNGRFL